MKLNVGLHLRFIRRGFTLVNKSLNFINNNSLTNVGIVAVAHKVHPEICNSTRKPVLSLYLSVPINSCTVALLFTVVIPHP